MSRHVDYPVSLRLQDRSVVLIGGGRIAEARAEALLEVGVRLCVVSPEATAAVVAWAREGRLTLRQRPYRPGDLQGAALAFSATDDRTVSEQVAKEARALGVWLNAADEPDLCDFTLPSVGRRGELTVAVSTGGQAPAVAAQVRRALMSQLGRTPVVRVGVSGLLRRVLPRSPLRARLLRAVARFGAGAGAGEGPRGVGQEGRS